MVPLNHVRTLERNSNGVFLLRHCVVQYANVCCLYHLDERHTSVLVLVVICVSHDPAIVFLISQIIVDSIDN